MKRTEKYGAVTKDEAQRSPSALLRAMSLSNGPSALLRAVSLSNGRWTFYEAVRVERIPQQRGEPSDHPRSVSQQLAVSLSSEQQDEPIPGPHVASFLPVRAARIMAAAHPTPLSTVIAATGQLRWQAPHSMHESRRTNWAMLSSGAKTPCGQTMLHIPQLMHRAGSN
jgi:hypothetical protein